MAAPGAATELRADAMLMHHDLDRSPRRWKPAVVVGSDAPDRGGESRSRRPPFSSPRRYAAESRHVLARRAAGYYDDDDGERFLSDGDDDAVSRYIATHLVDHKARARAMRDNERSGGGDLLYTRPKSVLPSDENYGALEPLLRYGNADSGATVRFLATLRRNEPPTAWPLPERVSRRTRQGRIDVDGDGDDDDRPVGGHHHEQPGRFQGSPAIVPWRATTAKLEPKEDMLLAVLRQALERRSRRSRRRAAAMAAHGGASSLDWAQRSDWDPSTRVL